MRKAIDGIFKYSYKIILLITIAVFTVALIGACFFYTNRSYDTLNPILLITGSVIYVFFVIKLNRFAVTLNEKRQNILVMILLIGQFLLLFLVTQTVSSIPQVDLIHILTEINSLRETGSILNNNYYSVYPNNKFLLILLYSVSRVSPEHTNIVFGILSSIAVVVTSLFTYKAVKLITDRHKALVCLFICVLSPIFYLYAPYYYTDILMLPFAAILFYLLCKNETVTKLGKNICYSLIIGLIAVIGYKIRAVSVFILIAYFVFLILTKKLRAFVQGIVPILLSAILTLTVISSLEANIFTPNDPSREFPMTHWIMMGVNEKSGGYYSQADYDMSYSAETKEERTQLNLSEIKNRLKELGFGGTLKLAVGKINAVWAKGDYSYQKYLELSGNYNGIYRYLIEDENIVLNYILQINKIGVLILCITALLRLLKENRYSVIAIALFGAVLFYLAWEVCPRYGLSFLPWMIILCAYVPEYNFDLGSKPLSYIKYTVAVVTVGAMCIGVFTCMTAEDRSNIIAKDTVKKVKYIALDQDTVLTQILDLYGNFDELRLKFKTKDASPDGICKIELIKDGSEIICEKDIQYSELNDGKYTRIKFDDTYPEGKYDIRLSTDTDEGVQVYVSYKEKFDYYPEGELYLNGKSETGDMMFEVLNTESRPLYSIAGYILLCVAVLGIEYFVLFKKERRENE